MQPTERRPNIVLHNRRDKLAWNPTNIINTRFHAAYRRRLQPQSAGPMRVRSLTFIIWHMQFLWLIERYNMNNDREDKLILMKSMVRKELARPLSHALVGYYFGGLTVKTPKATMKLIYALDWRIRWSRCRAVS
jgi:hypothetical protein